MDCDQQNFELEKCPDVNFKFLRLPQVVEITGLSKTSIWDLSANDPDFPKPVRILAQATGWRSDELIEWMSSRPRSKLVRKGKKYEK